MERWPTGLGSLKLEFVCSCENHHRKSTQIKNSFKFKQCPRGEPYALYVDSNSIYTSSEKWNNFQQRITLDSRFRGRIPDPKSLEILTDKLIRDRIECHLTKQKRVGSKNLLCALLRLNPETAPRRIIEALSKEYDSRFLKKPELELLGYGFLSEHREFGRSLKTREEVLRSILRDAGFYKAKISNKRILEATSSGQLTLLKWREIAFQFDENANFMLELIRKYCSKLRPTQKELEQRKKEEEQRHTETMEARAQFPPWRNSRQPSEKVRRERDLPWSVTPFSDRRGHPKGRR
jgi:hypothetical protein